MKSLPFLLASALLLPAAVQAQTVGKPVPPYQPPPAAAAPERPAADDSAFETMKKPDPFRARDDITHDFTTAYEAAGRPRLALYWNRQLTESLAQWYSDSRTVVSTKSGRSSDGDFAYKQSGNAQNTIETQRRSDDPPRRREKEETWQWEFEDGFVGAFQQAGANVVDRAAIMRIMGAGAEDFAPRTVEVMALQTMADLLVEVLVADSSQSTTGYELRARILDVRTGRILTTVNSRSLREWARDTKAITSAKGFELPDEDDDSFGPERADQRYKATASGFEKSRKPPKLHAVARNLAYNVMLGLQPQLSAVPDKSAATPPPVAVTPAGTPPAAPPMPITSKPPPTPPNQSALPRSGVESERLSPPPGAKVEEEPPMPKPTAR
ncbi:conserved exported hypothetical protein [Candidatus Terasakiella magnetica]|nr:conserved exported hypothetical protein [Candidatus Terasakiella magnetica]